MSYGVVESEFEEQNTEGAQGALSYRFRTRLDVNKEVTGNG
jgi:hypothetical protein